MKIAIEKFWCVKYYKAQPYNMEHTLCVCIDALLMCMCNFNIIVCAYITLFYFARENILVCEIL